MLDALLITRMQDEMTAALHETEGELAIEAGADGLMAIAMAQHRANFELWHEEDEARVPGVADAERHLDPPVARLEPAEQPREQIDARRRAPAEQEGAAVEAAQLPHCVLHSLEHREDAPGVLLEETARLGQADAPTEPVEERRVEPALQLLDLLGQRRLTEGEPLRRAAETARARDGEEDLELTERHRMPVR